MSNTYYTITPKTKTVINLVYICRDCQMKDFYNFNYYVKFVNSCTSLYSIAP
jgi:hypothetical protein